MKKFKLFINNEWVDAESGETFISYDPATGEAIAELAKGGAKAEGASVLCGGGRPDLPAPFDKGNFYLPTALADLREDQRCVREEIFGQAVELCAKIPGELKTVVTPVVGWDQADRVFEMIADPKVLTEKVVVDCEAG